MIQNKDLKRRIVEISYKLKIGHIGSCLTAVDIIEEIYKIKKPDEKFVLSAGHAHLAHAVVMEKYQPDMKEYLAPNWVELTIERNGIHCDRSYKGHAGSNQCDVSTGSLGHGIGIAVGMALSDRTKNVYCLLSDGECAEGSVFEAIRIAEQYNLTNLFVYLNMNGWAAYQDTKEYVFPTKPPTCLHVSIWNTNMNDYPEWLQGQIAHYKVLNKQEYNELMEILK